jgi:pimeloyl-ACP methyl ester carboxylesterase
MARFELASGEHLDFTLTRPSGPAESLVIYVHGFASHQKGEKTVYFRDRFVQSGAAYLAFDFRGHGASGGRLLDLTLSRCMEDLSGLIENAANDYRRIVLIGSSMGGQVAAWTAARYPDRIAANLLIAPSFRFYENRLRDLGDAGMKELTVRGELRVRNRWIDVTVGYGLIEDAKRYPMEGLLEVYRTPTLIFHGTADESVPYEGSVEFVQKSSARPLDLVLLAGRDHRLSSQKEYLFEVMRAFCERIGVFNNRP